MMRSSAIALGLVAVCGLFAMPTQAQTLKTTRVAQGLNKPLYVGAPAGDSRLWIVEQTTGLIKLRKNGAVQATPFINLLSKINAVGNERGLLGLAFAPDYATSGYFFVAYTANASPGISVIERYQAVPPSADTAALATGTIVLTYTQPFSNHNGGCLQFGPDGYLWIGTGDGGSANDPNCNGQNGNTLLGKMLRIDVSSLPYTIPTTNPFTSPTDGIRDEIWATGLRNPWRYSFDRQTGDLWIGDVGQNLHEEIDFEPANTPGRNYGWRIMEGFSCGFSVCLGAPACNSPAYTLPVYDYPHSGTNSGCSVTGGYVYRGCGIPAIQGHYFLADYCTNKIWSFLLSGGVPTQFTDRTADLAPGGGLSIGSITSFGEDGAGELYIVKQGTGANGEVYKILAENPPGGDCDLDGLSDACQIAADANLDLDFNGQLDLCQGLSTNIGHISAAAGGTQGLSIHVGASFAGQLYLTGGSISGTVPGLVFDGVNVPLNLDAYALFSLTTPNAIPLLSSLGFLNASGAGQTNITIPPGLFTSLAGTNFDHATVVLDLATGVVVAATNPIDLQLDP